MHCVQAPIINPAFAPERKQKFPALMPESGSPRLLLKERLQAFFFRNGYFDIYDSALGLPGLKARYPDVIVDIRGRGLLIGIKLVPNNRHFMVWARDEKLLIAGGGDNCVRLLPPLIITQAEAHEAIEKIERACETARTEMQKASPQ